MAYQVTDLMSDVIDLVEQRWVGSEEIWNLVNAMKLGAIERQISFLRELHNLVRHISIDVFNDEEQRQNLIQAIQKVLDEAIDLEEEEIWNDELD
ncbi:TyeA family type III secretion system gatekeeper subunit [Vibrio sp. 10N.222.54.F12]|jgi:type III secretion system TyeA family effector delivery regulator|uniref:TyeA family type III secretion system gatekeeper subunit n=2 Tax=Vibrio TaxID=662 RepID=A0ABV4KQW3_9VIBR|nr:MULTISPECIES: TyeA family type III secretion system gatekeeper subunit [Vibrio]OEF53437.1 SepL/TyeA/HrpJ family type III secretion system gatekeeper [Vibrio tasmaniensis 1F-267]OEF72358.1 SepL/TyeA/HrpJ family type III secretion system gatekeeper [Vibrio tasmaniensis 1F-187]OEF73745.1 SepL/TyeA/HrpJ family type III secretion system gatekeeper [Vibrio tasmaniensis 1F-155]PML15126.1 SepL/TyeA/HrpJ family type III secretion system gatekeeper [Vibrio tasmaniensis]PML45931.1 SepL/TyeA/HrpJ famil